MVCTFPVGKGENELLRKKVGELKLQSINEVTDVKRKEDGSRAIVAKK